MFTLKKLSEEAVPAALHKAMRYRLLNEPEMAENICKDILHTEPDNQEALTTLILTVTDQFTAARPVSPQTARDLLPKLASDYERAYYAGLIEERLGLAWLRSGKPRAGATAFEFLQKAMSFYEQAEALRPRGNDDAILRWNSCARIIDAHADIAPARDAESVESLLSD